jgi:hypothetical protein
MKTNKDQRQKYTLMKRYDKVRTQIKAKMKTKSSSRKRRTPGEIVRMKNRVFFANDNEATSPKEICWGPTIYCSKQNKTN